jgi:hypothetical protein
MGETMNVDDTIKGRDESYGPFAKQAGMAQTLKMIMRVGRNWDNLDSDMKEALDMIAAKMSRILIGNPKVADSWHDIAGYARLVELRLASGVNLAGIQRQRMSNDVQTDGQNAQRNPEPGLRPAGTTVSGGGQEPRPERFVQGFGARNPRGES